MLVQYLPIIVFKKNPLIYSAAFKILFFIFNFFLQAEENHTCRLCHRAFKNRQSLSGHMPHHYSKGNFKCDTCHRHFRNQTLLNTHVCANEFANDNNYGRKCKYRNVHNQEGENEGKLKTLDEERELKMYKDSVNNELNDECGEEIKTECDFFEEEDCKRTGDIIKYAEKILESKGIVDVEGVKVKIKSEPNDSYQNSVITFTENLIDNKKQQQNFDQSLVKGLSEKEEPLVFDERATVSTERCYKSK